MARAPLIWFSEEGSVAVDGVLETSRVREIRVTGGAREAEQIKTFGANNFLAQRPQEQVETTITAIMSGANFMQHWLGDGSTTLKGVLASGDGTQSKINVVYTWKDPTDTNGASLRIRFASGLAVSNEVGLAVDGQLEETFTFRTTSNNFFAEFSSGPASTLVSPAV